MFDIFISEFEGTTRPNAVLAKAAKIMDEMRIVDACRSLASSSVRVQSEPLTEREVRL